MTQENPSSPHLELISKAQPVVSKEADDTERRRKPRLSLSSEHFRLASTGKIFSLSDLSPEGMAIRVLSHEDLTCFPIAMRVEGVLNLKGTKYAVSAQVRHIGKEVVGCQFQDLAPAVAEAIRVFLSPEVLGRELRPIPSGELSTLWYHGPTGTDLLFWRGIDGSYHRIALYLHGVAVHWDEQQGLSTGKVQRADAVNDIQGVIRFDDLHIRNDSAPDRQKLDIAKALVLSSNLPEDMKSWCVRHLEPKR